MKILSRILCIIALLTTFTNIVSAANGPPFPGIGPGGVASYGDSRIAYVTPEQFGAKCDVLAKMAAALDGNGAPIVGHASLSTSDGSALLVAANSATDDTAAIQAAINSSQPVRFAKWCAHKGVVVPKNTTLFGAGLTQSGLFLLAGSNVNAVQTINDDGTSFGSVWGTANYKGARGITIEDMTIDANAAGQTSTGSAIDQTSGLAVWGPRPLLRNVQVQNSLGHGLLIGWGPAGTQINTNTGEIDKLIVYCAGRDGAWLYGNPDYSVHGLHVVDASQEADNTYYGLTNSGGGNGRFDDFHGWHNYYAVQLLPGGYEVNLSSAVANRVAYQAYSTGGNTFTNSHFEGGRHQYYGSDKMFASDIYAEFPSSTETNPAMVTLVGSPQWGGVTVSGSQGGAYHAIDFGTSSTNVFNAQLIFRADNFNVNGPLNFVNDGGGNYFMGTGYCTSPSTTTIPGTIAASDFGYFVDCGRSFNLLPSGVKATSATIGALAGTNASLTGTVSAGSFQGSGGVGSYSVTGQGGGFVALPTISVGAPPTGGTQATASPVMLAGSAYPVAGGSCTGYVVGDVVTPPPGGATFKVTAVTNGCPTALGYNSGGSYPTTNANPVAMTGGSGTGLTSTIYYALFAIKPLAYGSGYITPPSVAINPNGGSGGGATATSALGGPMPLGTNGATGAGTVSNGAFSDGSGVRTALTSSGYTVPNNTSLVRFTQAGAVTATITLPTPSGDGHVLQFVNQGTGGTSGVITATFIPAVQGFTNGGTIPANSGFRIRWDATAAAWQREQ